jgi:hypothetical protein
MPFDSICMSQHQLPTEKHSTSTTNAADGSSSDKEDVWECDYDTQVTSLYEAIEDRAWVAGLHFFKTGAWERGIFFASVTDPIPPSRQARTWVTRFETETTASSSNKNSGNCNDIDNSIPQNNITNNGKVRWSQLPIHAAIIFGAPLQFIQELLKLFPQAVKCTDDQHMLPLHLAFKFGSADSIVACLLQDFPEAIFTKDIRGRLPTEVEAGPRKERSLMVEHVMTVMIKTLAKRHGDTIDKTMAEVEDDLALQGQINAELEQEKCDVEIKYQKALGEIKLLQAKVEQVRNAVKDRKVLEQRRKEYDEKRKVFEERQDQQVVPVQTTRMIAQMDSNAAFDGEGASRKGSIAPSSSSRRNKPPIEPVDSNAAFDGEGDSRKGSIAPSARRSKPPRSPSTTTDRTSKAGRTKNSSGGESAAGTVTSTSTSNTKTALGGRRGFFKRGLMIGAGGAPKE